jgi:hypothetical protein
MKDFMDLGSSPVDEECVQLGCENYYELARTECKRYIQLLRKIHGPEPEGCRLKIKSCPHDFGDYLEVVCEYETENEQTVEWAFKIENNLPATWEGESQ